MKKMLMAIAAMLTMSASAMAQEDGAQPKQERRQVDKTEMVKHRTEQMVKKYGLNEEQAAQLQDLNARYADKMGPMGPGGERRGQFRGRPGGPRQQQVDGRTGATTDTVNRPEPPQKPTEEMKAQREEMRKNIEAYEAELQQIMTEEQFKAYKADQQQRANRGQRGPRGQRPHRDNHNK